MQPVAFKVMNDFIREHSEAVQTEIGKIKALCQSANELSVQLNTQDPTPRALLDWEAALKLMQVQAKNYTVGYEKLARPPLDHLTAVLEDLQQQIALLHSLRKTSSLNKAVPLKANWESGLAAMQEKNKNIALALTAIFYTLQREVARLKEDAQSAEKRGWKISQFQKLDQDLHMIQDAVDFFKKMSLQQDALTKPQKDYLTREFTSLHTPIDEALQILQTLALESQPLFSDYKYPEAKEFVEERVVKEFPNVCDYSYLIRDIESKEKEKNDDELKSLQSLVQRSDEAAFNRNLFLHKSHQLKRRGCLSDCSVV